jgi:hypothetical protein
MLFSTLRVSKENPMTVPLLSHAEITGIISDAGLDFQPFMSLNFGMQHITNEDKIYFDKIEADKRISVFQSPRLPGVARTTKGFQVESYAPGYIKDKEMILPNHVRTRRAGQPLSKPLNPAENYMANLVDKSALLVTRFRRTLEIMATNLLLHGSYSVAGTGVPANAAVVSFGRDTANTKTLLTTSRWLDANTGVSPWDNLEEWVNLPKTAPIKKIIMGNAAWRYLKRDTKFTTMVNLEALRGTTMDNLPGFQVATPKALGGVTYRGTLYGTGIPLYTYADTYVNLDGVETLYVPTDAVIGVPDDSYGFQCFASIEDANANYMGMEYFLRNWMSEDPANPQIMLQSAPLMVHTKIDSTFGVLTGATATGA